MDVGITRSIVRRHRLITALIVALLAVGLGWGLATAFATSSSPSPAGKVVLRLGWLTEPDNLNPFVGYSSEDFEIWRLNYNQLLGVNLNETPRPELATEVPTKQNGGVSADGTTYTFHLRHDVKWQDGVPFTSKDVAFTYTFILKNNNANYAGMLAGIKLPIETPDPYTVVIHTTAPKANMDRLIVPIVPEHIWGKLNANQANTAWTNNPPIIGTGPFQTVQWSHGHFVRLVANPNYFGGRPKVDEVIFETYQSADTEATDLKLGNIDEARQLNAPEFNVLKSDASLKMIAMPNRTFNYLGVNCYDNPASLGNPVLRDPTFRRALAWAVDRNKIVQLCVSGYGTPGTSVIWGARYGTIDYHWQPPADQAYGFDLIKAGDMLTTAGYPLKNGVRVDKKGKPISLRLFVAQESSPDQIAGKLMVSWFGSLGIKVNLSVLSEAAMLGKVFDYKGKTFAPDYDLYLNQWVSYPDPSDNLISWTTGQIGVGYNDVCWSNKVFDALFPKQAAAVDPTTGVGDSVLRRDLVWQMEQINYSDAPQIVVYYPDELDAYNVAKWQGWQPMTSVYVGAVAYINDNIDSYLTVHPKTATATTGGGSKTGLVVAVIVVVLVGVGAVVLVRRRRGHRTVEES